MIGLGAALVYVDDRGPDARHRDQPDPEVFEAPHARHGRPARQRVRGDRDGSGHVEEGAFRDAAAAGPGVNRIRGPGVRGGLGAGDLRHHDRPVHRLHQQHLRHPGLACAVLCAGGDDPSLPLPEVRVGAGPGVHRHENLPGRLHRQGAGCDFAGRDVQPDPGRRAVLAVEDPVRGTEGAVNRQRRNAVKNPPAGPGGFFFSGLPYCLNMTLLLSRYL
ncbi:hypothetical protein G6F57_017853 [Rhizopus arrhizus]|nr:hypothetical protein G6F57_017853 [Rhizopus arrhizus]